MAKDDNMFDFAKEIFKINEYASVASDGIIAGDFDGFLDSGSYSLNALLSGSIYGGFPLGKVSALVGASRMGKSFFVLTTMKEFLTKDPKSIVILFESESALSKSMLENFGIDTKRVMVIPVETVERFRHQCLSLLIKYGEQPESERRKMLIVLDSLGMLSTEKEMGDITEGKDTKDMTRAQIIKAAFRVLTLKLGKLGVPFLLTNHSYQTMGMFAQTVQGGGSGPEYAASTIVFLSKKKDKVGTDVVGNIIHCRLGKGRLTKENSMIDTSINYETGLNRWHGLLELAVEAGIWKKSGTRIEIDTGDLVFAKAIMNDVDKYFTSDILSKIDSYCKQKFLYGNAQKEENAENGESSSDSDNNDSGEEV
jgi:RecA/RadA recombinase